MGETVTFYKIELWIQWEILIEIVSVFLKMRKFQLENMLVYTYVFRNIQSKKMYIQSSTQ